jgi:hypothetical protein
MLAQKAQIDLSHLKLDKLLRRYKVSNSNSNSIDYDALDRMLLEDPNLKKDEE